jgi:hypothetical protein
MELTRVRVVTGRLRDRKAVTGTVEFDDRRFIDLQALVAGGDKELPNPYKRFREFLLSIQEADTHDVSSLRGSGTFFHPKLLQPFLARFGDLTMEDSFTINAAAISAVKNWMHSDVPSDVPSDECDDGIRRGMRLIIEKYLMPDGITLGNALVRVGFLPCPGKTESQLLQSARVYFHPDKVQRRSKSRFDYIEGEEIFKALSRWTSRD